MPAFHTIVCATDFSPTSEEAITLAVHLARDAGADIHLVHVVPDPLTQPWMVEGAGMELAELRHAWTEDGRKALVTLIAAHEMTGRVTPVVLVGTPAAEILQYVTDTSADLIVVGSHGHGVIRRFLLGSVAERVFKTAQVPVLVVPHPLLPHVQPHVPVVREVATAVR
jgi:universal stress protein A